MLAETISFFARHPHLVAGWLLVGGLALQVCFLIGGSATRLYRERKYGQMLQERFQWEVRAAQMRIAGIEQSTVAWSGIRKFVVDKKVRECADTYSYYLKPQDRRPLPSFRPGQYLTFRLVLPGTTKPLTRCYSLSECPRPDYYRVSIKRCAPPPGSEHPPGLASSYFSDFVEEGDVLDVKAPSGHFYLDLEKSRPVVLISGGIGVTPMISMANALREVDPRREIWFFFGARNSLDHMFKEVMDEFATRPNFHLHVCYSKPLETDVLEQDYHHEGRVTVELFKSLLPSNNYDYFLCGPGPFMESITGDLRTWGVPDDWVHFEAFGPASVKRPAKTESAAATAPASPSAAIEVTFAKSARKISWDDAQTSLLEFAEGHGIPMEASCRAGGCGACRVQIKSGEVEYLNGQAPDSDTSSCLACICKPKRALVLDA